MSCQTTICWLKWFSQTSPGRKAATAVLTGGDYQKNLLNSFDEVQKQSDYLIQKAQNSHFATTRAAILEVLYSETQALYADHPTISSEN